MIHSNVSIGEGTYVHEGAIVGEAPRGRQPGELKTVIGAGGVIRSGTVIYAGTVIGDRFNSGHGALIREDNLIGDDCSVGTNAVLEAANRIGNGTRIHSGCFLAHVTLGARVFLGPHVVFTDDPHPMCPRYLDCVLGATVEDDVSIGANATILPGLRIGERRDQECRSRRRGRRQPGRSRQGRRPARVLQGLFRTAVCLARKANFLSLI